MAVAEVIELSTEGLKPEEIRRGRDVLNNLRMRRRVRREMERLIEKGHGVYGAADLIGRGSEFPVSARTARRIRNGKMS